MPYGEDIRAQLPEQCLRDNHLWRVVVPLICFNILEWHQPDRVLFQFGLAQPIPRKPAQDDRLHDISLRGKVELKWTDEMVWYKKITRCWMDVKNARLDLMVRLIYIFLVLWSK